MEMFFLSYVNETMCLLWNLPFFKMVPPKTNFWLITAQQTSMFYSYIVLIYINETIYLRGNLPFVKIPLNCFMAWHDSPCAKVTSKYILWVRGLMPPWGLRHFLSLIKSLLIAYNILLKSSTGALFLLPSDVYIRSFLYLFYILIKLY